MVLISKTSTQFQLQREGLFSDRVSDAELPDKFHDNFRLVKGTPVAETPFIPPDLGEQALIQDRIARDNQSMFIGDSVDSIKAGALTVGDKVNDLLDTAAEFSGDLSRSATELPGRISAGADRVEDFFARQLRDLTGRPTN